MDVLKINKLHLIIPFLLWALLPSLSYNLLIRIVVVILIFIYLLVDIFKNKLKTDNYTLIAVSIIFYMLVINFFFTPPLYNNQHIQLYIYISIAIISSHVIKENTKDVNIFLYIILIANLITVVITINELFVNINVARILSKSDEVSRELFLKGVGGYNFVYYNLVLLPWIVFYFKQILKENKRKYLLIILSFLNIVFIFFLLIKSQYTIALIILLILSIIYIFNKIRYSYLFPIFIFLGVGFLYVIVDFIDLEAILSNTRYLSKFRDIKDFLSYSEISGTFYIRYVKYLQSLTTFSYNPIIGSLSYDTRIGMHSELLDILAQFGSIFGLMIIGVILYVPIKLRKLTKAFGFSSIESSLSLLAFFLVALFNILPMQLGVVLIFASCSYTYAVNQKQT